MRQLIRLTALSATVALAAGCSSSTSSSSTSSAAASSSAGVTGTVTVLAAASLTETFTKLGQQFQAAHPGATVKFSFGASSSLAQQITQGAPADVFASAATTNMDQVVQAGYAANPTNFVKNVMEIAVPPTNPAAITGVADLAKPAVKVALCQPQVPCGATAAKVFTNAKITVKPVTLEADVKATLTKVETGEVDAGVVYVTDVKAASAKVKGVTIPDDVNASTSYPIVALNKATNAAGASAFVDYVRSADGQAVLSAAGFEAP